MVDVSVQYGRCFDVVNVSKRLMFEVPQEKKLLKLACLSGPWAGRAIKY